MSFIYDSLSLPVTNLRRRKALLKYLLIAVSPCRALRRVKSLFGVLVHNVCRRSISSLDTKVTKGEEWE